MKKREFCSHLKKFRENIFLCFSDLLLKYSARDDDCKALAIVLENQDELIASKLLALKAHKDIEYDINKKGISDQAGIKGLAAVGSLAYRYEKWIIFFKNKTHISFTSFF